MPSDTLTVRPGDSRIILLKLEKLSLHPVMVPPLLGEGRDSLALVVEMTLSRQKDGTNRLTLLEYTVLSTFRYWPPSDLAGVFAPLLVFRSEGVVLDIGGLTLMIRRDNAALPVHVLVLEMRPLLLDVAPLALSVFRKLGPVNLRTARICRSLKEYHMSRTIAYASYSRVFNRSNR